MTPTIIGILLALAGLYTLVGAIGNWDWFMENRKARRWVKLIGRNGTRVFYIVLGALLIVLGMFFALGIIQ